jgi:hypothetical protein
VTGRLPELHAWRDEGALAFERASATPAAAAIVPRTTAPGHTPAPAPAAAPAAAPVARLSLAEQQRWLQTVITHPRDVRAGVERAGAPAESVIEAGAHLGPIEALEIYHYAYRARLVECLADDYPALAYALGESAFAQLAGRYVERHPSRSPNLISFGRHVADFCREQADPRAGFWADLARFEWALVEALHAEDAPALAADELARVAPEAWAEARLVPSDTLRLGRFDYPVNEFFRAFRHDEAPPTPAPEPLALAIYREGFTTYRMELTPAMAGLLDDLAAGTPLGAALGAMEARLTDPDELAEAARNVMAWFSAWVKAGFFRRIELPDRAP